MAFRGQYEYKIEIDTMEDAKKIVAIAGKLQGKIVLHSGSKFSVNAKSLLGVLLAKKLNWSDLKISMEQDHYSEFEKYKAEAKERWGKTDAYKEHAEKTQHYSKEKWDHLVEGMNDILAEFAVCMKNGEMPDSTQAQNLVKMLQNHITENYYRCSNEILVGLGQMYVADERFKNNIDKHADGTSEFIREAIEVYCRK